MNQFGLTAAQAPHLQEVSDTRFMVVCFDEPVMSKDFVHVRPDSASAPKLSDAEDCSADHQSCPAGTMCMCMEQKGVSMRRPLFSSTPSESGLCKCLAM